MIFDLRQPGERHGRPQQHVIADGAVMLDHSPAMRGEQVADHRFLSDEHPAKDECVFTDNRAR